MEHDIYKPPQAELSQDRPDTPEFYVVSERKFLLLAIATLGMYFLYWFYQHWKNQKIKHGENIWPVARALFNIFFTHALFGRIDDKLADSNINFAWSPNVLATIFVLAAIVGNIADRISAQTGAPPVFALLSLGLLIPLVWTSFKAQQAANLASGDAAGTQNSTITAINIIWIVLGLILWALALLGLFVEFFGLPAGMLPAD